MGFCVQVLLVELQLEGLTPALLAGALRTCCGLSGHLLSSCLLLHLAAAVTPSDAVRWHACSKLGSDPPSLVARQRASFCQSFCMVHVACILFG